MSETQDIWAVLEESAPAGCDAVQDLYSWSLNYDAGTGPFPLLLDLIGWSADEYDDKLWNAPSGGLGYVECEKLARALTEYANDPQHVTAYVQVLMDAEVAS